MTEDQSAPSAVGGVRIYLALAGAAIWLVLAGVVGAIYVSGSDDDAQSASADEDEGVDDGGTRAPGDGPTTVIDPNTGEVVVIDPATGKPLPPGSSPGTGTGSSGSGGSGGGPATTTPTIPGNRTGVSAKEIKVGIHAPKTIGGAPLNLAEDPLEGIEIYTKFINDNGGIHGRKIVLDIADDRYETTGGQNAGIALIERGNFIISGTLGVDQINAVAKEANKAGVPYHAAGGHEPDFTKLGLYQISTSYDTHVIQLARWMNTPGSGLKGKKIGISVLDSPLLVPVADVFKNEAVRVGLVAKASDVAVVKIKKPTEQSSYSGQINDLKGAGTQVLIPMQDPISTGRIVNECVTADCPWTYTFSNFAHESDTALTLMGGQWGVKKVRGLAAWCYYLHPNANNPAHCAHMDRAHARWVAVNGQSDWEKDGQGGATGYQIMSMLAEGLRRAGGDPTRESYRREIVTLAGFDDLISSPITFKGKSSYSHGSDMMVVYEAQTNTKYQQIVPGLVKY